MLDRVSDITSRTVDPGHFQGPIQYLSRRSDKWLPGLIFLVTRLFANKDNPTCSALTEYCLSRVPKQRTGLTFCRFFSKFTQIAGRWHGSSFAIVWFFSDLQFVSHYVIT